VERCKEQFKAPEVLTALTALAALPPQTVQTARLPQLLAPLVAGAEKLSACPAVAQAFKHLSALDDASVRCLGSALIENAERAACSEEEVRKAEDSPAAQDVRERRA
jgi:hypothetical protein